ncbi:lipopolysaccharide biosynthesis protein [Bacteroidota bacterium]
MLGAKRYVNNVTGLQAINILRFLTFLIISIVFTKIGLSKEEIGLFEVSIFIASAASFFWVSGLIQSFLPLFKSNKTFGDKEQIAGTKSPEVFNMYVILVFFSILVFLIGLAIKGNFSVFGYKGNVPLLNITLWYLLLSSPANLVEYIYMVQDKNGNTLSYGYITSTLQLIAAILPVLLGYDVIWSLRSLVVVSIIKNIWLVTLLYNYAEIKYSFPFIKEVLAYSGPIILSVLVSGSAQYVDGMVVTTHYSADGFAIFRYGAKELPFVLMMAAGLSSAMLVEFSKKEKIKETLAQIKKKSLRIMHSMYPLSIFLLLFAKPIYKGMFSPEFTRSADVFVIYLLAIVSRILFPHTIIIGLKKGKVLFWASIFELIANILLSLYLVDEYGVVGVALATIIVYFISKVALIGYNYLKLGISPLEYIPIKWYAFYSIALGTVFVLLDRGILVIK